MNPEQEIEQLNRILDQIIDAVESIIASGEEIPDELAGQIAEEISATTQRIQQLTQEIQQEPQGGPPLPEREPFQGQQGQNQRPVEGLGPPPSPDAQLLWILAGQQEDAFAQYLQTYSTEQTQELLRNPSEFERVVRYLHTMMPSGQQPVIDGIQHADLNSSTIWGTSYNPSTKKMKVRFQGGDEYEYDNIPTNIYRAVNQGNASATTKGQNQYGRWWPQKNPSMGAALNQYVKQGGFPYRKIN